MSTIFAKTAMRNRLITTICYNGKIYETTVTDGFGRMIKSCQVDNINQAKRNHMWCVERQKEGYHGR